MTFYILKFKDQLHCGSVFCPLFSTITQEQPERFGPFFHIWSDTELMKGILGGLFETALVTQIIRAARLKMCVKHSPLHSVRLEKEHDTTSFSNDTEPCTQEITDKLTIYRQNSDQILCAGKQRPGLPAFKTLCLLSLQPPVAYCLKAAVAAVLAS